LETPQSDRKGINSSPISGLTVNFNKSIESVSNTNTMNKSPVLNHSPNSQDEWQMKLFQKKKGLLISEILKCYW